MRLFEVYTDYTKEQNKCYRFWRFKISPHHDTCTHYNVTQMVWFVRIAPHFYIMKKAKQYEPKESK
jgi:hypothetical protein